ncbi:MAG TPA: TIGR02996 domain-containing protein [Kofleriaceae bacterium]|nr:TIGR02996 domain-containing protein [Kofleriaceae bacterium]
MTDELDALLAAVHAAPGDLTARLVYADALQQRGDPLGEYLAVQCRLDGMPQTDPAWPLLRRRAHQLRAEHGARWDAHRLGQAAHPEPTSSPRQLAAQLPAYPAIRSAYVYAIHEPLELLVDLGQVTELSVQSRESPARWLASGVADRVQRLRLEADARWIEDLPRLPALEALTLQMWTRRRAVPIPRLPDLASGLRELALLHVDIPATALRETRDACSQLEKLVISGMNGDAALALAGAAPRLRELALLGARDLGTRLAALPALGQLRSLVLAGTAIGGDVLSRLLPRLSAVEELDLSNCRLDATAARLLATWSGLPRVHALDLSLNPLGDGARAFADTVARPRRLVLNGCAIGDAGAAAIATCIDHTFVLGLERCGLTERGLAALVSHFGPRLLALDLRHNPLGAAGHALLIEAPRAFEPLALRISPVRKLNDAPLWARYGGARRFERHAL